MPAPTHTEALDWIARWDRQQEALIPEREERFNALIDAIEVGIGRPDPLVIDLGCGPGSLAARLLDRLPAATVVAVDADPLLLSLGQAGYAGRPGLEFVDIDLSERGWAARLKLERPVDVAMSTTALHWLRPDDLRTLYAELATVLRPGGLFLNGDRLEVDDTSPTLARLGRDVMRLAGRRLLAGGDRPEAWEQWWEEVAADPALAEAGAERERRRHDHPLANESDLLSTHVQALTAAGFTEIATLWQRGGNRVLAALAGRG